MRELADWQMLQPVLKTEREILQEVLLCAARYDVWMTLEELAHKTRYPEASISAQLRHLRKAEHGGFVVEKRRRLWAETTRPSVHEKVWEYQMRYGRWDAGRTKKWRSKEVTKKDCGAWWRGVSSGAEEAGWELERTGLSGSSRADMEPVTARLKSCPPSSREVGTDLLEVEEGERRRAEETMRVKPEMAFDVCWEVYRGAREVLEAKRGITALTWEVDAKYSWRPDLRPKLKDWVVDFALAGQAALEGPQQASRMVPFRLYYLGLTPYERARHFLGLSERSWVNWSEEIRRRCGEELLRRDLFPPRKYFGGGD